MTRLDRLSRLSLNRLSLSLVAAGSLALAGCSQTSDIAKQAAGGLGQAAKEAAKGAGQAALAPAVTPVLDLLKKGEAEVKGGNLAGAVTTLDGFQTLWDKAGPMIQPLAGDKWPTIETAAKTLISTYAKGSSPDAAAASSAISGLAGPLSALIGQ